MKGLYRGFCRNENGTETIVLNGEKIKGEWKYGYLVEQTENGGEVIRDKIKWKMIIKSFIFPKFKEGCYEVLPETVCEAVRGLTDRNGKQVFEGDIVNTKYGRVCRACWVSVGGFVGFDLDPMEADHKAPTEWDLYKSCNIEVIGTIFDEQFAEGV